MARRTLARIAAGKPTRYLAYQVTPEDWTAIREISLWLLRQPQTGTPPTLQDVVRVALRHSAEMIRLKIEPKLESSNGEETQGQ